MPSREDPEETARIEAEKAATAARTLLSDEDIAWLRRMGWEG